MYKGFIYLVNNMKNNIMVFLSFGHISYIVSNSDLNSKYHAITD